MANLLLISDEPASREALRNLLTDAKHAVTLCNDVSAAPRFFSTSTPDLVCLDVRKEDRHVDDFWAWLLADERCSSVPVLLVLPLGARWTAGIAPSQLRPEIDGFIGRPLSRDDLQEKVASLLANACPQRARRKQVLRSPPFMLDASTHVLSANGEEVSLTPTEQRLLTYLMEHPGDVVSGQELLEAIWGFEPGTAAPGLVRVHLSNLRRKMAALACGGFLQTLPHRGYRLLREGP